MSLWNWAPCTANCRCEVVRFDAEIEALLIMLFCLNGTERSGLGGASVKLCSDRFR